jgi:hypothetical protein
MIGPVIREWLRTREAAPVSALGAWVRLYAAAAPGPKGIQVTAAQGWTPRIWLATANLLPSEIQSAVDAGLARWDGPDLLLEGPPEDRLSAVRSFAGKVGGSRKQNAKQTPSKTQANVQAKPKQNETEKPSEIADFANFSDTVASSKSFQRGRGVDLLALQIGKENQEANPEANDPRAPAIPPVLQLVQPSKKPRRPRVSKSGSYSEAFKAFWEAFPDRRKHDPDGSWRKWQEKAGDHLLPVVLAALEWQKPMWAAKDDGEYTPGPAPYLNKRMWEMRRPKAAAASGAPAMTPEEETRIVAERRKDYGVSAAELAEAFPWMAKS